MRIFPLFFLAVMVALHVNLVRHIRCVAPPGLPRLVFTVLPAAFGALLFARSVFPSIPRDSALVRVMHYWLALVIMVNLVLLFRESIAVAAWFLRGRVVPYASSAEARYGLRAALVLGVAVCGYALYEAQAYRIRTVVVPAERLPAGVDRIRIAALTDLHFTRFTNPRIIEEIVEATNARRPDIVVIVGDVVDGEFAPDGEAAGILRRLRAERGVFAVVGNHDVYSGVDMFSRFMAGSGVTLLRGASVDAGGIRIIGADDPRVSGRAAPADVLRRESTPDAFTLFLCHRPELPREGLGYFDLEISGHTHGGQIWPFGLLVRLYEGVPQGLSLHAAPADRPRRTSRLYVSNGTRHWGPPVRFLTPPEIAIIDLKPANRF